MQAMMAGADLSEDVWFSIFSEVKRQLITIHFRDGAIPDTVTIWHVLAGESFLELIIILRSDIEW